jgi:HAD superfamily hydrolase (TIGR01509 family)
MSGQEIVRIINEKNGLELDPDRVAHEKEDAFLEMLDEVQPIEPVVKLLNDYLGHMPIAAGTGGFRKIATRILKSIGVWEKIDTLVGSDDVEHHKPHPHTFLRCAELLGVAPGNCVVFEDAELGFQAARRAGMHLIDVRPYYNNISDPA